MRERVATFSGRRKGNDGNAVAVGQRNRCGFINENSLPSLYNQNSPTRAMHALNGGRADGRHVESAILLRLGHFDDDEFAAVRQLAGTDNGPVGAFDGFDGQYSFLPYRNALSHVKPAH